jgi:TRAP transporter TAXI family solute receptor
MAGSAAPVNAQGFERNILTGGPTGTYIQFGRDIADAAAQCGVTLNVQESAGSLENFLGVRVRRHTQFGIVQSDVLEYLNTFAAADSELARAVFGVRIAFPLYNEEVHVLARRDIGSLQDLAGRRVSIGVENSGTFLTASLVLDLAALDRPSCWRLESSLGTRSISESFCSRSRRTSSMRACCSTLLCASLMA